MIRSLELYPGPKADFREACVLLRSDNFAGDRLQILYARTIVTAEGLLGDRLRFLIGTEDDPSQFYTSPGMPVTSTEPFFRRLARNRGFFSIMLRGTADRDSATLSKRGFIDTSGGHAQGLRLLRAGQPQRAAIAFSQALEKCPSLHNLHYLLGRCYLAVGDTHAAVDSYTAEMKASRHPLAPLAIGKILDERGDRETSRLYYQEALQRDGLNLAALQALAMGYMYSGDFEEFWETFARAHQLGSDQPGIQELIQRAAGVFKIDAELVIDRAVRCRIPKELLQQVLLHKTLFENGAFLMAQEAFERILDGLRAPGVKSAVATLYSEMVKNSIGNVGPWDAARVVPKLHYSLEGLKDADNRELMLNYGTVLETAFRDLRWFIDPLWANYLVEDLEELQSECCHLDDLGVYLLRVYGNLLEDQVHLGRPEGIMQAQDRLEDFLGRQRANPKLPYTYLTCLSYLMELAAGKDQSELALSFFRQLLATAREHPDNAKVTEHTANVLESLVERLTRQHQWELLESVMAGISEASFPSQWKDVLLERVLNRIRTNLPTESPDLPFLARLRQEEAHPSPRTLLDPVLRGIRNLVGVPVPGAILVVRSDPEGKEIFINGRGAGLTPRRFEDFSAGEYTVGVGSTYRRVQLKDGSPLRIKFRLNEGEAEIEESFEYAQPTAELKLAGKLEKLEAGSALQGGLLEVRYEFGVRVVHVRRDITPVRELSFQEELLGVLGEDGPGPLVVDLTGVHWIGSLGIALLAKLYQMNGRREMVVVRSEKPDFRVEGKVCHEVKSIFDFLLKYVPASASLDEAVALARQGGRVN
ncbi:MAG: PEGA domain-containing protein [Candidatus Riflebacteria bacterium]|nr:PEGA domain-containing protein [Candidatus Riflebacteria bacterium]